MGNGLFPINSLTTKFKPPIDLNFAIDVHVTLLPGDFLGKGPQKSPKR